VEAVFDQVVVMFYSNRCVQHGTSPKERTTPDDLLYVGHRDQQSPSDMFLFLVPHHTFASDSRPSTSLPQSPSQHDPFRPNSGKGSESQNPFKFVEAGDWTPAPYG
jgi:hypothetical protein